MSAAQKSVGESHEVRLLAVFFIPIPNVFLYVQHHPGVDNNKLL